MCKILRYNIDIHFNTCVAHTVFCIALGLLVSALSLLDKDFLLSYNQQLVLIMFLFYEVTFLNIMYVLPASTFMSTFQLYCLLRFQF